MTDHDVTEPRWGRNAEILRWGNYDCRGFLWMTPPPNEKDVLVIRGKKGPIRIKVTSVRWLAGADDMYEFEGVPA